MVVVRGGHDDPRRATAVAGTYDVVVVGGGAAGLSAGLVLARARRSVLVIDAGAPRNAPAQGVHGFLSRDGVGPADLLGAGRAEVERYGGRGPRRGRGRPGGRRPGSWWRSATGGPVTRPAAAGDHGAGRRTARRARTPGTVGPGRGALPLLPRVGGAGPADRDPRHRPARRPPGSAVPAVDRRPRAVHAHRARTDRRAGRAVGRPRHPRRTWRGGPSGGGRRPAHRGPAGRRDGHRPRGRGDLAPPRRPVPDPDHPRASRPPRTRAGSESSSPPTPPA